MKIKRILALVFAVILSVGCCSMLFACNNTTANTGAVYNENWTPTKKKAMVLIPGLMASTFYNLDEENFGEELWGVTGFVNLVTHYYADQAELLSVEYSNLYPNEDISQLPEYQEAKNKIIQDLLMNTLSCDENGIPKTTVGIANMSSSDRFGSFNGMIYDYNILYQLYRDQYDIIVWQYDWRASVDLAGKELARFIDQCGYEKVQFFTHSMGGIVVANWLQEKAHRDMTELFVPFGGPFLGSMDAVKNLFFDTTSSGTIAQLLSMVSLSVDLKEVSSNIPSVYQLLPFSQFFDSTGYENVKPIQIDGQNVTFDQFYDKLLNSDIAKVENGNTKTYIQDLQNYQNRYFVKAVYDSESGKYVEDENGEYVHVSWLVPTEYIVGVGVNTIKTANLTIDSTTDNIKVSSFVNDATEFDAIDSIYNKYIDMLVTSEMTVDEGQKATINSKYYNRLYYSAGDGTVPAYSASCGLSLDSENVHLVYGISHGPLGDNTDTAMTYNPDELTGLAYLKDIMKKYIEKTDLEIAETTAPSGTAGVENTLTRQDELSNTDLAGQIVSYTILGLIVAAAIAYTVIKIVKSGAFKKKNK